MTANPTLSDLQDEGTWLEWRSRVDLLAPAIRCDRLVTTADSRAEFLEGARLLRLDHLTRAGDGGRGPSPIQLVVADLLAAGVFLNAIDEPRRTTKTTSVQCVMLGRARTRDDYQIGWTMLTTGAKAGERFRKDIVAPLERLYPDPRTRPMRINVGKGTEHIDFRNGSFLNVYSPNGDGFRSGGFDMALVDEGGEGDVEQSQDIQAAVIPTMDTKPGAQLVVAGTGATFRAGNILWDALNDPDAAALWHGIPEITDPAALASWEPTADNPGGRMRELIELHHPGVGYTTPIEAVERSYKRLPLEQFLREYGGQFGLEGATDRIIPAAWWSRAGLADEMPPPPPRFCAFLKVHHDGSAASLGVAFDYEPAGDLVTAAEDLAGIQGAPRRRRRAIAVWHHQPGTVNLDREVLARIRRRRVPLVFDNHGHTKVVAAKLERAVPRPTLIPTRPADVPLAVVTLMQGLEDGTVVHFRQPELDRAAEVAVRQAFGQYGTFRFGAPKSAPDEDLSPLEAAAGALQFLDDMPDLTAKPTDAMQF